MSDARFHRTELGQQIPDATVPALGRELARLRANLERQLEIVGRKADGPQDG